MITEAKERCVLLAEYIVESKDTVRGAAARFGISKSTVHKDATKWNGYFTFKIDTFEF